MGCYCSGPEKAGTETIIEFPASLAAILRQQIKEHQVLLYSSLETQESQSVKEMLRGHGVNFEYFEVEHMSKRRVEMIRVKSRLRYGLLQNAPNFRSCSSKGSV